jgi:hypothetical protein
MLAAEDFIDVVAVAANLRGKPRWASSLAFHHRFYYSANMYGFEVFHKKSVNRFALNAYQLTTVPLPICLTSTKQFTPQGVNLRDSFRHIVYLGY